MSNPLSSLVRRASGWYATAPCPQRHCVRWPRNRLPKLIRLCQKGHRVTS